MSAAQPVLGARGCLRRPFRRVLAVIDGPNPSFDYYLAPRLRLCDGLPVETAQLSAGPSRLAAAAFDGALVLFCRYVSPAWLRALRAHRRDIAAVALFVDDDLAALAQDAAVPLVSRLRYRWRGTMQWRGLSPHLDLLLVSTPELARRHAAAAPLVMPPVADGLDCRRRAPAGDAAAFTVAYHATRIHGGEHAWLMPVAAALMQDRTPGWRFEVTAAGALAARWARCPGVRVVPPLPWPDYRRAAAERRVDLMLAPLLPTPANLARSCSKRIDAARAAAALIVSEPSVYQPQPAEAELGMCVTLEPGAWVAAIRALGRDPTRLRRLAQLNRDWLLGERSRLAPLFERDALGRGWVLAPQWRLRQAPPGRRAAAADAQGGQMGLGCAAN